MPSIDTEGFLLPADNGPVIRTFIKRHGESAEIAMIDDTFIDGDAEISATCRVDIPYGNIAQLLYISQEQFRHYGWNKGDVLSGQWKEYVDSEKISKISSLRGLKRTNLDKRVQNHHDFVTIDTNPVHLQLDAYPHYDTDGKAYNPNGETLKNNGAKTMCLTSRLNVGDILVELLIGAGSISESERANFKHLFSRLYGSYDKP